VFRSVLTTDNLGKRDEILISRIFLYKSVAEWIFTIFTLMLWEHVLKDMGSLDAYKVSQSMEMEMYPLLY
jgi:hypothetical protein